MNHVQFILAFENGELDDSAIAAGFQALIDDGTVWHLQGSYQRMAAELIGAGICTSND